jgi:3-(methylthio)propanoyl-CoA dehydrogenase
MGRQGRIADGADGDPAFLAQKRAAARFYVERIVPEAMGLKAAAMGGAALLYSIPAEAFAA